MKIWIRLAIAILCVVVASGAGLVEWAARKQREIAIDQARDFAESVHQMTLAGLTGMMITGTVGSRAIFLDQIKQSNHIESLRVLRGEAVTQQFGVGLGSEVFGDDDELRVVRSGSAEFFVVPRKGVDSLRAIIPIRATDDYLGKNCLNCHTVPNGTVMGVVSMDISLARAEGSAREFKRNAIVVAVLICLPLGLFVWYFISRIVSRPLRQMTDGLNRIAAGDIASDHELPVYGNNEIDEAKRSFNRVIGKAYELLQQQRLSRIVFDNSLEGITVTDAKARIQMVNKAFTDTTGYSEAEALGQTPAMLKSGKQDAQFYQAFWKTLQEEGAWQGEIWNRRKNGTVFAEWLNVSAVRNTRGEVENYVAIFSDITERKEREALMTYRAFHDALTGLPNRLLFRDRLEQALAQAKRHTRRMPAVMFLDLDRFKQINDTLGHEAGDMLLKEVANRLRSCVRSADTVARLAGDEFTVLLPDVSEEGVVAQVADKILAAMQNPVALGSEERVITTSIGIALYPRDGADADAVMKAADTAMYHVKGSGRADKCFYNAEAHGRQTTRRAELEESLRLAHAHGEFMLHFQPIFDLETGAVHGQEALLRWRRPDGEVALPEEFIEVAEEMGLMIPLGEWVLENACRQAARWQAENRSVAVNLSATEFRRDDLCELIRGVLERTGLRPELLEIELPEALIMQEPEYAERAICALADIGVRLTVDDFGTAYSSLLVLSRMPIHTLKIDDSLIRSGLAADGDNQVLLAIFSVAAVFGYRTVAEGVDKQNQIDALKRMACHRAQGNYLAPPTPEVAR